METEQMSFWKRKWVRVVGVVLCVLALIFAGLMWLGLHMDDVLQWKVDRDARIYSAQLEAEREQLVAMERADTYGSTTPEGTVALIITALEAGDTTLASKYYYVLDQEKAKASFEKQLAEKGNLDTAITFFKDLLRGTKGCNDAGDGCTLEYEYLLTEDEVAILPGTTTPIIFPKGSKSTKANDFEINSYTGNWKAIE